MAVEHRQRPDKPSARRLPARSPAGADAAQRPLAWYVGLGLMAVLDVIDWQIANVIDRATDAGESKHLTRPHAHDDLPAHSH